MEPDKIELIYDKIKEFEKRATDHSSNTNYTSYIYDVLPKYHVQALHMIAHEHQKNLFGYIVDTPLDLKEELAGLIKGIKGYGNDTLGRFLWQVQFVRRCEKSLFCKALESTSRYKNEEKKMKENLEELLERDPPEYLISSLREKGISYNIKSWIFINLIYPRYPKWSEVNQEEFIKTKSITEILDAINL